MTNLWFWNCVPDPWNFRETMVFILLRNIAHSLKFELISCKIGLVSFSRWNLIHMNCFIAKLMTATTVMTNCAMFQKRIALHESIYCFQSSEPLGGFWSFLKLYMHIQIKPLYPQSCLTKSERRNIKLRCYSESRNSNSGTSNVSNKKHPDYTHRWPEIQLW